MGASRDNIPVVRPRGRVASWTVARSKRLTTWGSVGAMIPRLLRCAHFPPVSSALRSPRSARSFCWSIPPPGSDRPDTFPAGERLRAAVTPLHETTHDSTHHGSDIMAPELQATWLLRSTVLSSPMSASAFRPRASALRSCTVPHWCGCRMAPSPWKSRSPACRVWHC